MEQKKLQEELNHFKKHLVLNQSLREITIKGHTENIKRMLQKIQTTNPEKEDVIEYVFNFKGNGNSYSYISNNISSIEKYMDFKKNLVRFAKPKRPKALIKNVLSEAEISQMIRATKNIREKAMMTLLAYSGIRNLSFCNLKVKDVDFGENTIVIRKPKGSREYITNVSSECIKILLDYLKDYPKKSEDYLFTTIKKNNQYQPSDLRKFVQSISKKAGIDKRVFPHLMRHSLASNLRKRGANIEFIQEHLGHDDIESTMIYARSFPTRIKSEFEFYKPAYI